MFLQTEEMEAALDVLQDLGCVLLVGPPGSGKRTLAHALLRCFGSKGATCHVIKTFAAWRNCVGGSKPRSPGAGVTEVALLDHAFGRGFPHGFEPWRAVFDVMEEFCRQGTVRLVFTFHPHTLLALRLAQPNCNLFRSDCEIKMGERLGKEVKKEMLLRHLTWTKDEGRRKHLDSFADFVTKDIDKSGAMFPGCCERMVEFVKAYIPPADPAESERHFQEYLKFPGGLIFSRPSPMYKDFVSYLLSSVDSLREELLAALSLLLNHVDLGSDQNTSLVLHLNKELGFSSFSRISLLDTVRKFSGTLVKEDASGFINRHAYDGAALAIGEVKHADLVVKVADMEFLVKRCVVPLQNGMKNSIKPYVLEVKRVDTRGHRTPQYRGLVRRIAVGLSDASLLVSAVQHDVLQSCQFVEDVLKDCRSRRPEFDLKVLAERCDSHGNASLLYWTIFNDEPFLFQYFFKKIGRDEPCKANLTAIASACCVLASKEKFLATLLKYWKKVTRENAAVLLQGKFAPQHSLVLPRREECFSQAWRAQRKHLQTVLRDIEHISSPTHSPQMPLSAGKTKPEDIDISQPPLHLATKYNNQAVVKLIMEKHTDSRGVVDKFGRTALHVAALHGRVEIAKSLVMHPDLLTTVDEVQNNALHEACLGNSLEVAQVLLGACPHLAHDKNQLGSTPGDLALLNGNSDLYSLLC